MRHCRRPSPRCRDRRIQPAGSTGRALARVRPPGYAVQPRNHNGVAAAVVQGRADWGVTLDTVARTTGLGFIPVQAEQYDFIVPRSRADRPAVIAFKSLLEDVKVRRALERL